MNRKIRGFGLYRNGLKRLVDVAVSLLALTLLSPILIAIGVLVKLDSPGPVLFKQQRSGRNGEVFQIRKFRSMAKGNNLYDTSTADQVTRIGRFLRRTSLDELPQLVNVLLGDMSLIGPRPWVPEYFLYMNESQRVRYKVRPGITGLAQATGRNSLSIFEKIDYDLRYVEELSFSTDLKIVRQTLRTFRDESTLDIGKAGINEELAELREANGVSGDDEVSNATAASQPRKVVFTVTTDHAVQYHADLAKRMVDEGWYVTFVSSGGPSLSNLRDGIDTKVIRMERNPSPIKDLKCFIQWISLLRTLRPDLVIAGTPKAGMLGIVSAAVTRIPGRVYWLHGLRLETAGGPLKVLLWTIERAVIAFSTDVLAVSGSLRNRVLKLRLSRADKIQVLGKGSTQGVDVASYAPVSGESERRQAKELWGLDPDRLTIGFVGRLTKDKGVEELGSAAMALADSGINFQLLLVGPVEDSDAEEMLEKLSNAGVRYNSTGRVSDTSVAYRAMDIFCLPSYREGLPNVVLEAFASGIPVVASDVTGNRDLVVDGSNGLLVPVRNAPALTKALRSLLLNSKLRSVYGREGRSLAVDEFMDIEVVDAQYRYLSQTRAT